MTAKAPVAAEHALVTLVENKKLEKFGFYMFRVEYEDEGRWERFVDEYEVILYQEVTSAAESTGLHRIKDKFEMIIVEDEITDGVGAVGVASTFAMIKTEDELEPGYDLNVCLLADAECIASVIDPRSESDREKEPPFLKMVHVTASRVPTKGIAHEGSEHAIVRKVNISSLIKRQFLASYTSDSSSVAAE